MRRRGGGDGCNTKMHLRIFGHKMVSVDERNGCPKCGLARKFEVVITEIRI